MATASPSAARTGATNGTTPADIEKQLETIRDDISELTQQVADLVGQTKDDAMAQVKKSGPARQGGGELGALRRTGDRPRGGRRVPRRGRHVRRRGRGFAEAPALRDARGRRRHRLPVRRRLAALIPAGKGASMFESLLAPLRAKFRLAISGTRSATRSRAWPARSRLRSRSPRSSPGCRSNYGSIIASLIMAGAFLRRSRSFRSSFYAGAAKAGRTARRRSAPQRRATTQWISPATLLARMQAARMLGKNRGIAAAGVGCAARRLADQPDAAGGRTRPKMMKPRPSPRSNQHDGVVALDAGADHLVARPLPPVLGREDLHFLVAGKPAASTMRRMRGRSITPSPIMPRSSRMSFVGTSQSQM